MNNEIARAIAPPGHARRALPRRGLASQGAPIQGFQMSIDSNSRLGLAIKQIARDMTAEGKDRVRVTVIIGRLEATYELKLVRVRTRRAHDRAHDKHGRH